MKETEIKWTHICNKCGTTKSTGEGVCTAPFPQRTSGICGGAYVLIEPTTPSPELIELLAKHFKKYYDTTTEPIDEMHPAVALSALTELDTQWQGKVEALQTEKGIIGKLTNEVERLRENVLRRTRWIDKAKRDAGYDSNISFDDVWNNTLKEIQSAQSQLTASEAELTATIADRDKQIEQLIETMAKNCQNYESIIKASEAECVRLREYAEHKNNCLLMNDHIRLPSEFKHFVTGHPSTSPFVLRSERNPISFC